MTWEKNSDLPVGTILKWLGENDLGLLLVLQDEVASTLPEEHLEKDDASFYKRLFEGQGEVLGLFQENDLIASAVISWPAADSAENLGYELGMDSDQRKSVANLEAAYMLPSFQGKGIARVLSSTLLNHARSIGMRCALSTVSPANIFSVKNLFYLGFTIRKITLKYGGKTRFIMYLDLIDSKRVKPSPASSQGGLWVRAEDIEKQKRLLAEGCTGTKVKEDKDGFAFFFAPDRSFY